jgi:hypothetical protein
VKHNASDAPIAIERVVIVVGPSAVRAAFGCTFEGQQWALHGTISLRQYLLFLSSFCQKAISAAGAFDVGVYRLDVQIEIRN